MSLSIKKIALLIVFISSNYFAYSQYVNKDTLYFIFEKNNGSKPYYRGLKKTEKNRILFNDLVKGSFFYENKDKADTLNIKRLEEYAVFKSKDIDSLVKAWRKKNKQGLIDYYGKIYPPFDNNGMFKTYLIEIINEECFVIYPVKWRNQGVKK